MANGSAGRYGPSGSAWTPWTKVPTFENPELIYEKRYREIGGGVARITANRPERYNAMAPGMGDDWKRAMIDASLDDTIGVVVLTGVKHFGTGGDVQSEAQGSLEVAFHLTKIPDDIILRCRKPIIAAVRGYCIGGSNHFAYLCDFTIADTTAVFGQVGPRIGSPADGYIVSYLTRVVGAKKARELWMLCRRYTAQEALEMGLVNTVVEPEELDTEVERWCDEILSLNPTCLTILRATFNADIDYMEGSFGRYQNMIEPHWFQKADIKEAQQAFFEKRRPNFWYGDRLPDFLKGKKPKEKAAAAQAGATVEG